MGGQVSLEGSKRHTAVSTQLQSPRYKARTSHIRLSDTPKSQAPTIILTTPPSTSSVQSINVGLLSRRKYRPRRLQQLTDQHLISPIQRPLSSSRVLTDEDLLEELPSPRAEHRTYKLHRKAQTTRSTEEDTVVTERRSLFKPPNVGRRESLAAAIEFTRAPLAKRSSLLPMTAVPPPSHKERPRPLQLQSVPETPAPSSWSALVNRRK